MHECQMFLIDRLLTNQIALLIEWSSLKCLELTAGNPFSAPPFPTSLQFFAHPLCAPLLSLFAYSLV